MQYAIINNSQLVFASFLWSKSTSTLLSYGTRYAALKHCTQVVQPTGLLLRTMYSLIIKTFVLTFSRTPTPFAYICIFQVYFLAFR